MKISDKMPPIKIEAYIHRTQKKNNTKDPESKGAGPAMGGDKVELSQTVREMGRLKEQLKSIPDVREEKVKEIKGQINAGTYKIDGKKIAFNMIKESLIDETV